MENLFHIRFIDLNTRNRFKWMNNKKYYVKCLELNGSAKNFNTIFSNDMCATIHSNIPLFRFLRAWSFSLVCIIFFFYCIYWIRYGLLHLLYALGVLAGISFDLSQLINKIYWISNENDENCIFPACCREKGYRLKWEKNASGCRSDKFLLFRLRRFDE